MKLEVQELGRGNGKLKTMCRTIPRFGDKLRVRYVIQAFLMFHSQTKKSFI